MRTAHLLAALLLLANPVAADDGLTKAQRAQIADPSNPQFAPLPQQAVPPADDETGYLKPVIPTEEAKIAALKLAYKINGDSMVGHNEMIDLTKPIPVRSVKVPVSEVMKAMPIAKANELNPLDRMMPVTGTDTCTRHGLHKVTTHNGKSWRCK